MSEFFHGTETSDVSQKIAVINSVNASTIALIGVAPDAPAGMSRVSGPLDAGIYGRAVFDGRTIPHALEMIFAQGAGNVIVINCFKEGHLTAIAAEAVAVTAGKLNLAHVPIKNIVVKTPGGSPVTLVNGTDYKYTAGDKFIEILTRVTYPDATNLVVDYKYFDATKVVAADIVGADTGGVRTGMFLLDMVYANYQVTPKILIAPIYIEQTTVCNALVAQSAKLRGRVLVDAPSALTRDGAIASRGPAGTYANFNTGDQRVVGLFPYVLKPDPLQPLIDGVAWPYSACMAGAWSKSIVDNGIGQSPSNITLNGFKKLNTPVSCTIGDKNSDANILNTAGICTIFTGVGSNPRLWGNRNFGFIGGTGPIDSFLSQHLTRDIIADSLLVASLLFQDKKLTTALIDTILSSVNVYLNSLILSNDLIGGVCTYDPAKNTPEQLATGKIIIDVTFVGPTPAENIVYELYMDITLFSNIAA